MTLQDYEYDQYGNLIFESYLREEYGMIQSSWSNTYEYDENGNLTFESYSSDWDNDGIADDVITNSYTYDENGNKTYESHLREEYGITTNNWSETYEYDEQERVVYKSIDENGD